MIENARLPPIYRLLRIAAADDVQAHADRLATEGADPATVVCADRADRLDCALVLHPEAPLEDARLALYVAMLGLGDALGSVVPPGIDMTFRWPNVIEANLGSVAWLTLSAAATPGASSVPQWMTLRTVVALSDPLPADPSCALFETTLAGEGAVEVTTVGLLESFSRHFLSWIGRWQDDGFAPVRAMWLRHASRLGENVEIMVGRRRSKGIFKDIADDGALLLETARSTRRIALQSVLKT